MFTILINRKDFYDSVRESLFGDKLLSSQVSGMEAVLNEWERRLLPDLRWLAYMFGTIYWECAKTMQPIEEYGKGRGRKYGKPDPVTGQTYYGRSFVQLTWLSNYEKFSHLLGIDLVNYPEKALELHTATQILFEGMIKGLFTGVGLPKYFNDTREDWVNARRIINGTDRAATIANISSKFHIALT